MLDGQQTRCTVGCYTLPGDDYGTFSVENHEVSSPCRGDTAVKQDLGIGRRANLYLTAISGSVGHVFYEHGFKYGLDTTTANMTCTDDGRELMYATLSEATPRSDYYVSSSHHERDLLVHEVSFCFLSGCDKYWQSCSVGPTRNSTSFIAYGGSMTCFAVRSFPAKCTNATSIPDTAAGFCDDGIRHGEPQARCGCSAECVEGVECVAVEHAPIPCAECSDCDDEDDRDEDHSSGGGGGDDDNECNHYGVTFIALASACVILAVFNLLQLARHCHRRPPASDSSDSSYTAMT
jgi:hypothetical protein